MSVSISDNASFLSTASAIDFSKVLSKNFRLAKLSQRIGQTFGTHRLKVLLQVIDFLLGGMEPIFKAAV